MKKTVLGIFFAIMLCTLTSFASNGSIPDEIFNGLSSVVDIQNALHGVGNSVVLPQGSDFGSKVSYTRDRNSASMTINVMGLEDARIEESAQQIVIDIPQKVLESNLLSEPAEYTYDLQDRLVAEHQLVRLDKDAQLIVRLKEEVTYTISKNPYGIIISLTKTNLTTPRVILDPGHGGKDPGAISKINGVYEKSLTLKTALALRDMLQQRGYEVIMTRDSDVYPTLTERAALANDMDGDIFVSIHYNATTKASISGIETYAYSTPDNQYLAEQIHRSLIESTGAVNRGVKSGNKLVVLNRTKVPAVLLELGFLTNANEANLVTQEHYQSTLTMAIADGIDRYFGR